MENYHKSKKRQEIFSPSAKNPSKNKFIIFYNKNLSYITNNYHYSSSPSSSVNFRYSLSKSLESSISFSVITSPASCVVSFTRTVLYTFVHSGWCPTCSITKLHCTIHDKAVGKSWNTKVFTKALSFSSRAIRK